MTYCGRHWKPQVGWLTHVVDRTTTAMLLATGINQIMVISVTQKLSHSLLSGEKNSEAEQAWWGRASSPDLDTQSDAYTSGTSVMLLFRLLAKRFSFPSTLSSSKCCLYYRDPRHTRDIWV